MILGAGARVLRVCLHSSWRCDFFPPIPSAQVDIQKLVQLELAHKKQQHGCRGIGGSSGQLLECEPRVLGGIKYSQAASLSCCPCYHGCLAILSAQDFVGLPKLEIEFSIGFVAILIQLGSTYSTSAVRCRLQGKPQTCRLPDGVNCHSNYLCFKAASPPNSVGICVAYNIHLPPRHAAKIAGF